MGKSGNERQPIFWQRPWWTTAPALAMLWGLLLAYGTLLPFDLEAGRWFAGYDRSAAGFAALLTSPRWIHPAGGASSLGVEAWVSDLLTNLALYLPLGVLGYFAAGRWISHPVGRILAATAAAATLSWTLESTQSLSPTRYATINDWLTNTGGALAGAVLAHPLRATARAVLFWLHRRTARVTLPAVDAVRRIRRGHFFTLIMLAVGAVLMIAVAAARHDHAAPARPGDWLPFLAQFRRAYDVAAVNLLRSGFVYVAIALLLALPLARRKPERALLWLASSGAAVALLVEGVRAARTGAMIDVTEPVLAVTAAAAVLTAVLLAVDGIRRSCRRRAPRPVDIERRRRTHDYRFARA